MHRPKTKIEKEKDYWMMEKLQKPSNSERYTLLSELFRI
jgi:hypothetical protein